MSYQKKLLLLVMFMAAPILLSVLIVQSACVAGTSQSQVSRRVPLQKSPVVIKSPTTASQRILRYDPKTNEPVYYDPQAQVVVIDEKSGKYAFKWVGYDGKEKLIPYQRADAIDVVVIPTVTRTASGRYTYIYNLRNLPSSSVYLSGFIVQNFSQDVEPTKKEGGYVGLMTNLIQVFKEGNWIYFGSSYFNEDVDPGHDINVQLASAAPPGLVGCRATGGDLTLKGVGEDMPPELEDAIPGYEEFPRGMTIGPIDYLKDRSTEERVRYVADALPQMQQLGWITEDAARWYKRNLNGNNLSRVQKRAAQDLKAERITSEVFAMIEAIN